MQPVEITTMNKLSNNLDLHDLYVGHQISMQPYEYTLLVITHVTTHKLAQVVTGLQTSHYKYVYMQTVNKLCSHCLFLVVVTSLQQAVNNL
jgi:hypothetical protein